MKKLNKIFLLFIALLILTTYLPREFNYFPKKNIFFFKIKNIEIIDNKIIKHDKISKKLTNLYGKNIFFVTKNDLKNSLKKIDFLENVEVKKKYPNTIIVKIFETKPIGFIFKNNKKYIIDSSSNLILEKDYNFSKYLPTVFGKKAEESFIEFFEQLKINKFDYKSIKNYYYFKIGRWDLQLANNQIIKFPHDKLEEAIQKFVILINKKDFQSYNIIDLRTQGKIVVE